MSASPSVVLVLLLSFFGWPSLSGRAVALQPSEKFLFAREQVARFVAQLAYDLIARLGEPWHAMRRTAVFLFVRAFAAPVEDRRAAFLPVAHSVPVAGFVGTQALIGPETTVAPDLRHLVEARI